MADDLVERLYHIADKPWDLGNQEISAAAGEAAAEIARLRVHEHELGKLLAVIFRDGGHHQAAVNDTHEAVEAAADRVRVAREGAGIIAGAQPLRPIPQEVVKAVETILSALEAAIRALKEPEPT